MKREHFCFLRELDTVLNFSGQLSTKFNSPFKRLISVFQIPAHTDIDNVRFEAVLVVKMSALLFWVFTSPH
jgi:hypothetical protein